MPSSTPSSCETYKKIKLTSNKTRVTPLKSLKLQLHTIAYALYWVIFVRFLPLYGENDLHQMNKGVAATVDTQIQLFLTE